MEGEAEPGKRADRADVDGGKRLGDWGVVHVETRDTGGCPIKQELLGGGWDLEETHAAAAGAWSEEAESREEGTCAAGTAGGGGWEAQGSRWLQVCGDGEPGRVRGVRERRR